MPSVWLGVVKLNDIEITPKCRLKSIYDNCGVPEIVRLLFLRCCCVCLFCECVACCVVSALLVALSVVPVCCALSDVVDIVGRVLRFIYVSHCIVA